MTAKSFFSKIFTVTAIVILTIALCIPIAEEVYAAPKKVKVTFNVNGGKALAKAKKTKKVIIGKKVGTLPKTTKTGYTLKGWYTKKSGGSKISKNTKIKKNATYYARWTAKSYTVKFDANGGTTPTFKSKKVKYNARYGALPTTSRVGHDFKGWYTAKTGGKKITANDINVATSNGTLYAQWGQTKSNDLREIFYLDHTNYFSSNWSGQQPKGTIVGAGWYKPGTIVKLQAIPNDDPANMKMWTREDVSLTWSIRKRGTNADAPPEELGPEFIREFCPAWPNVTYIVMPDYNIQIWPTFRFDE